MNRKSMEENLIIDHDRLQKGQIVRYEGKEAVVICAKPLPTIKTEKRVICGNVHTRIESVKK